MNQLWKRVFGKKSVSNKAIAESQGAIYQLQVLQPQPNRFFTSRTPSKLNWVMVLLLCFTTMGTVLNTAFIAFLYFRSGFNFANLTFANQMVASEVLDKSSKEAKITETNWPSQQIIDNFSGNSAFVEIGSKVLLKANSLEVPSHANCQTPVLPPLVNNCYVILAPATLGLPEGGIFYRTLELTGHIPPKTKIMVSLKNYDSGKEENLLRPDELREADESGKMILRLPATIRKVEGLRLNFWLPQNTNLYISNMKIVYFDQRNLHAVSGKLNAIPQGSGLVYLDTDENAKFDPKVDQLWSCRPNFSGAHNVTVDPAGNFEILRDDSCVLEKPETWKTAKQHPVLPAAKWLLVFDNGQTVYAFDMTKSVDGQLVLEL